jgi:hypothetical protein
LNGGGPFRSLGFGAARVVGRDTVLYIYADGSRVVASQYVGDCKNWFIGVSLGEPDLPLKTPELAAKPLASVAA